MKRYIVVFVVLVVWASSGWAEVVGEPVEYTAGEMTLKGYVAYDDAVAGPRPGVLVVHEWWGHNPYAQRRARELAALGYTALAVDMYGEGKQAEHPDDAMKFSAAVKQDMPAARARFEAGKSLLEARPDTDGGRMAAIGYCFGGGVVLEMARGGVDLKGVVSFHGSLGTDHPTQAGAVKARMLVCNGEQDGFVTQAQIDTFKEEMEQAEVDMRFVNYPGAVHSFTNPDADKLGERFGLPLAYNEAADTRSWEDMRAFLESVFAK